MIKKLKNASLPFMTLYTYIYIFFISGLFYLFLRYELIKPGLNYRLNQLQNNPFEELFFVIGFFLFISFPITVILSLFSISKKLTKIERIIKDDYEKKLKD